MPGIFGDSFLTLLSPMTAFPQGGHDDQIFESA
jgi:hypothetical protein